MTLRKFFVAAMLLVAGMVQVSAQDMNLPQERTVRKGNRDNGLTYDIRHNNYHEKVANSHNARKDAT